MDDFDIGNEPKTHPYLQLQTDKEIMDEVKEKLEFYFSTKQSITFRSSARPEYFFTGVIEKIIEEYAFLIRLQDGSLLMERFFNVDPHTIHPSSYQPIRYFEREPINEKLKKAVMERDNYQCQLKMEGCLDIAEECDHIIPVSKGGRTTIENLQASCKNCNLKKGNRI